MRSSTSALSQRASTNVVLLCVFLCHPLFLSPSPLSFCVCPLDFSLSHPLLLSHVIFYPHYLFSCEPHRPSPAPGSNDSRTRAPQVFPQIFPTVSAVSFARLFARIQVTQVHLFLPVPFTSRASLLPATFDHPLQFCSFLLNYLPLLLLFFFHSISVFVFVFSSYFSTARTTGCLVSS